MATNENPASDTIKRFAIDSAGRLGSFYNGYRDCILGQLDVRDINKSHQSFKSSKCQIIKDGINKKFNALRLFGIQDELLLSILLNLSPKTAIASVVDYSHSIQELTRILSFHYLNGEEQLSDYSCKSQQPIQSLMSQTNATHIITGVSWGFCVIAILQLPSEDETVRKIDDALEKIRTTFENGQDDLTLDAYDENLLQTNISLEIYSNVPELTRLSTFGDLCRHIDRFKNGIINYPLTYTLQSITCLYPEYAEQGPTFAIVPPVFIDMIQKNIFQMLSKIKNLEISLNDNLPKLLYGYLKGQLYDAHQQWSDVNRKYLDEVDRLSKLLVDCRSGQTGIDKIKQALHDENHMILARGIDELMQNVKSLEAKGQLIGDLLPFKYCNVAERDIDEKDTKEIIERKLVIDEQHNRVLCTNDVLNKHKSERLNQLRNQLVTAYKENPSLRLIYADFSYMSFDFRDMMILPTMKTNDEQSPPKQEDISAPTDIINILLLGESGAGKSTFINALVNYLTFDSLKTAEHNKPVILIPVSFIMTAGHNFKEYIVEFDNTHQPNDENFNSFGQSVTQHCKSYILHLKNNNGKKLRIIDTPGFGDTRGSEYDDHNMQHILEYTNSLTHLNAICFILKPNIERLNIGFRSCVLQLIDHLGSNTGENIIFCFTNARTTFFSPGNTAPLLRTMLTSISMNNIPFKKENTFCFDSESFRYLAALQKDVPFDDLNKSEYENSWSMSIKESKRLIDYIGKCLPTHRLQSDRQSIKHAQFQILHMIRPLLEAIRNILRNILLYMSSSQNKSIELHPKTIYRLATQCRSCKPNPIPMGNFYILPDLGHEIHDKCLTCSCTSSQHSPIEYVLEYECSTNMPNFDEMQSMLQLLFNCTVEFAHFLLHGTCSTKDDPFLSGVHRMIEEEKDICGKVQSNEFNVQLVEQLEIILHGYKERMDKRKDIPWDHNLSTINDRIKTIIEHPMVREQITAIKNGQEIIMNHHEYIC